MLAKCSRNAFGKVPFQVPAPLQRAFPTPAKCLRSALRPPAQSACTSALRSTSEVPSTSAFQIRCITSASHPHTFEVLAKCFEMGPQCLQGCWRSAPQVLADACEMLPERVQKVSFKISVLMQAFHTIVLQYCSTVPLQCGTVGTLAQWHCGAGALWYSSAAFLHYRSAAGL